MKSPIRVGLVVRWPTGGIRTYLKYLYTYLPAGKYRPVLVAPGGTETDYLLRNLSAVEPVARLVAEPDALRFGKAVLRCISQDKLDIVHSHGFTSAALSAVPARLFRVPHVATMHDVFTDALATQFGRVGTKALGLALRQAQIVQAVGNDQAANLREKLLSESYAEHRLRVIKNGIDIDQFLDVDPRPLRSEFAIDGNAFIVGFLGLFMAQKGFRTLIEAVRLLRDEGSPRPVKVFAVGDGGYIREDQARVRELDLDSRFIFHPMVENPASTLAGLDCLAMPSAWEAFGLLAAEALCLGVPVIASDCVGLREVVADSAARVFRAGDANELAQAIRQEMIDPSGARARGFAPVAQRSFDIRRSATQLDQLFGEVLAAKCRPGQLAV
jgi:glycosyltransferase involved in cell wall biosynthesis